MCLSHFTVVSASYISIFVSYSFLDTCSQNRASHIDTHLRNQGAVMRYHITARCHDQKARQCSPHRIQVSMQLDMPNHGRARKHLAGMESPMRWHDIQSQKGSIDQQQLQTLCTIGLLPQTSYLHVAFSRRPLSSSPMLLSRYIPSSCRA